jgi:hypothetical protein
VLDIFARPFWVDNQTKAASRQPGAKFLVGNLDSQWVVVGAIHVGIWVKRQSGGN